MTTDKEACCAHVTLRHEPVYERPGYVVREDWRCKDCGAVFGIEPRKPQPEPESECVRMFIDATHDKYTPIIDMRGDYAIVAFRAALAREVEAAVLRERARACTNPVHEAAVRLADQVASDAIERELVDVPDGKPRAKWCVYPVNADSGLLDKYRASRPGMVAK